MTTRLTTVSLGLNVLLAAVLIWVLQRQTPQATADEPVSAHAQSLGDSPLLQLHARLRGAGLDEATSARILVQVLQTSSTTDASAEYWKASIAASRAHAWSQYDELQKARGAVRDAIGEVALSDPALAPLFHPYGSKLDFLSPQKQMALQDIEMQSLGSATLASTSGESAQIKALLSSSELQEYRYRTSDLRQRLLATGFDFTRDEYRATFDAVFATRTEQEVALTAGILGDTLRDPQLAAQIRKALGAARFATFRKVQDPLYVTLRHVGATHSLSAETVDAAYAIVSASDQGRPSSAGRQQLSSAQAEAELRRLLGPAAFELLSRLLPRANSSQFAAFSVSR
jgi:hypothetical protein